ncbi:MAG TPA: ComEC/Rec2 family competence protein, partial [Candidatus Limnocylindrales bacterium]|nr:ComEC/Rec2 family competence protein [Candidatus Limnocylindrales bacterium]
GAVLAALVAAQAQAPLLVLAAAAVAAACWAVGGHVRRARRLGLVAAGSLVIALRLVAAPAPPPTAAPIPDGDGPWNGVVMTVGAVREGSQVATLRLAVEGESAVAATLPRFPEIEPGQRVVVEGSIRPPPDGPYGDYLRRSGVTGTLRTRVLEVVPATADPATHLERLRRHAGDALAAAIPAPEAGLAAGIVVGLRDRVDRGLAADFTTVGVSHIVAISGWNIAIVAASVAALGVGLARRRRALLTAGAIAAYVLFAGASPSVVRAAAMAGVVLVARETGRAGRAAAALGWAAVLLLLADPRLVNDAGFQLSALATAGILAWASSLQAAVASLGRGRLPGWLVECLAVSLAAQAATLPIVLLAFGRLAIVAPAVNLVVVPLVAPAMAACGIALLGGIAALAGAPTLVATLLGLPAWFLLSLIVGAVEVFARLPFASAALEPPWNVVGAALSGLGPVAAIWFGRRRRRTRPGPAATGPAVPIPPAPVAARSSRAASLGPSQRRRPVGGRAATRAVALALVASLVGVGLAFAHRPDGLTRITVLDVGQGDAILVEGGRGGRLLVDGGPDPDRLLIELDRRLPPWDRRIDAVVLTHPHEDHVAGLALLLSRYRVGRVFEPGMRGPGPGYREWAAILARPDAPERGRLLTGDRLAVDGLSLRVLWPDPGRVPAEPPDTGRAINDVSIVLLGEVDGRRFLLTGDVEDDVDPILAGRGLPPIDFLKVAHHGSATASTDGFLELVRPSVAIVSAGADNPYGHPARSTLERLKATGARVLRTDADGSVEVAIGGGRMTVRTSGPRGAAGIVSRPVAEAAPPVSIAALARAPGPPPPRSPPEAPVRPSLAASPFACAVPSSG